MLDAADIDARLREMRDEADPRILWDQNCEGSARALVVFVGPSPGADPNVPPERFPIKRNGMASCWGESYNRPLAWSPGFRASFQPFVETLFSAPYDYAAASKLIGRANLDWHPNPKAAAVPESFMKAGGQSVLRMLADCSPELVLPMEKRAFRVLKDVMQDAGFILAECPVSKFYVRLNAVAAARTIDAFRATSPVGRSMIVIRVPQHFAKMFEPDCGRRCGQAVRTAAIQIASGQPVDVTVSPST